MRMIGCVSPVTDGTLRIFGLDPARDGVEDPRRGSASSRSRTRSTWS